LINIHFILLDEAQLPAMISGLNDLSEIPYIAASTENKIQSEPTYVLDWELEHNFASVETQAPQIEMDDRPTEEIDLLNLEIYQVITFQTFN